MVPALDEAGSGTTPAAAVSTGLSHEEPGVNSGGGGGGGNDNEADADAAGVATTTSG